MVLRNAPVGKIDREVPTPLRVIRIVFMLLLTVLRLRRLRRVRPDHRPNQRAMFRLARMALRYREARPGRVTA